MARWRSNMTGFDPAMKRYAYDPKKARELLTKAGYPNGFESQGSIFHPTVISRAGRSVK